MGQILQSNGSCNSYRYDHCNHYDLRTLRTLIIIYKSLLKEPSKKAPFVVKYNKSYHIFAKQMCGQITCEASYRKRANASAKQKETCAKHMICESVKMDSEANDL